MKPVAVAMPIVRETGSDMPRGTPLLRLGFRPFYLAAAWLAMLAVPVWLLVWLGQLRWTASVQPLLWHAHEMLFGFASAVIIGFLFTAGKAWTGLGTPRGAGLAALVLLWLAARVAALVAPYPVYALLDVSLLPVVAAILIRLLLRARNTRNLPLGLLLVLLALANLVFHLAVLKQVALAPMLPLQVALALIVMIESVMAGRVIPGFTMSATPGLKLKTRAWSERATLALTAMGLAWWIVAAPGWPGATLLTLGAGLHAWRQWTWCPWVTRRRPILWILHAAYAWIWIGLGLLALAQLGLITPSAGIHALAVGATGGLIIGMITRTARGHTSRPLNVSAAEVAAYVLVMAAAMLRVFAPLLAPTLTLGALVAAALTWSAAFAIYLVVYTPWLCRARLDGRDG